jgi:hypothetical protein
MLQQIIALIIIIFFILKLASQKRKQEISRNEFRLWLFFWIVAALAIVFIKQIDYLIAQLGFSGSGINFLIYLSVLALFYLVFRLRLSLAKTDQQLTELSRAISLLTKK